MSATRRPPSAGSRSIHFDPRILPKESVSTHSFKSLDDNASDEDFVQDDSLSHSDGDVDDAIDLMYKEHQHHQLVRKLDQESTPSSTLKPPSRHRPESAYSARSRENTGYLSSSSGDHEATRVDYVPDRSTTAQEIETEQKEDALYSYISSLMTELPKPRKGSSGASRPSSGRLITEGQLKAISTQMAGVATSRPSTAKPLRPFSASAQQTRPTSATTTKSRIPNSFSQQSLDSLSTTQEQSYGKLSLAENASLEARIYEANCKRKIREANDMSRELSQFITYELTHRATTNTPFRVLLKQHGRVLREISMDMFNREHRRLKRDFEACLRGKKTKSMEDRFRALFDRDPEENAREAKMTMKDLLVETMQLISKLQEQTMLVHQKNEFRNRQQTAS